MWITVGARNSRLSKNQVIEVFGAITKVAPNVRFHPHYLTTLGDRDLKTPLSTMDKTDFFTRDIEEAQMKRKFRISVHSAKDLPEQLRPGLKVMALTKGVCNRDVLLTRKNPRVIATSSHRREEAVRKLFPNVTCKEVRGSVESRVAQWKRGDFDGLAVANAALIRLGLTHIPSIELPGESAPLQGQLAIVGWSWDRAMETLFTPLDTR